jgi:hypothetical protein
MACVAPCPDAMDSDLRANASMCFSSTTQGAHETALSAMACKVPSVTASVSPIILKQSALKVRIVISIRLTSTRWNPSSRAAERTNEALPDPQAPLTITAMFKAYICAAGDRADAISSFILALAELENGRGISSERSAEYYDS